MNGYLFRAATGALLLVASSCGTEPAGPSSARSIALRPDGSWVVAGRFEGGLSLPGRSSSAGRRDAFVAGYDAEGEVVWTRSAGGEGQDEAWAVATLADGSCLVTGEFEGKATFSSGDGHEQQLVSVGESDAFFARYDANGVLQWARSAGGAGPDHGRAVAARRDGTLLVAGRFAGELAFARGEPGERRIASAGKDDSFVIALDPAGVVAWVTTIGGPGRDYAQQVVALEDGSCLVAGSFERTAAIGGSAAAGGLELSSAGKDDAFVLCLDPDGRPVWARSAGGEKEDSAHAVAAFPDGSYVVTGRFEGRATFGADEPGVTRLESAGKGDAFMARYDAGGRLAWVRTVAGTGSDYGRAVAVQEAGTAVFTGYFSEEAALCAGEPDEARLASEGRLDIFLARLDANGRLSAAQRLGGWGADRSNGIVCSADGALVLAGERPIDHSMMEGELLVTRILDLAPTPGLAQADPNPPPPPSGSPR